MILLAELTLWCQALPPSVSPVSASHWPNPARGWRRSAGRQPVVAGTVGRVLWVSALSVRYKGRGWGVGRNRVELQSRSLQLAAKPGWVVVADFRHLSIPIPSTAHNSAGWGVGVLGDGRTKQTFLSVGSESPWYLSSPSCRSRPPPTQTLCLSRPPTLRLVPALGQKAAGRWRPLGVACGWATWSPVGVSASWRGAGEGGGERHEERPSRGPILEAKSVHSSPPLVQNQ